MNITAPVAGRAVVRGSLIHGHLHQIDLFRVVTFAGVIAVHVMGYTTAASSVGASGLMLLLHYTRQAFFFLTAFVLFHAYYARPLSCGPFWRRRFRLVGIPYLLWTVVYTAIGAGDQVATPATLRLLGVNLLAGTAWYHLYFLLVSMQVYLLLPLLIRLVRATEGHHMLLLAAAATVQATITTAFHYDLLSGLPARVLGHAPVMFLTYAGFLVAGAIAATHLDRFHVWTTSHPRAVTLLVAGGCGAALGWYLLAVAAGEQVDRASQSLQPAVLPWAAAAVLAQYSLGCTWATRRGRRSEHLVQQASAASFGIYLVHPAVIRLLADLGVVSLLASSLAATLLVFATTSAVSLGFTHIVRRTALSTLVVGRDPVGRPVNRTGARTAGSSAGGAPRSSPNSA